MHPALFAYTHKTAQTPAYTPPKWRPSQQQLRTQLNAGQPSVGMENKLKAWGRAGNRYFHSVWNPTPDVDASRSAVRSGNYLTVPGTTTGMSAYGAPTTKDEIAAAQAARNATSDKRVYGQEGPGLAQQTAAEFAAPIAAQTAAQATNAAVPIVKREVAQGLDQAAAKAKPWLLGGGLGVGGLLAALAYGVFRNQPQAQPQMAQNMAMAGYGGWGQQLPPYDPRAYR